MMVAVRKTMMMEHAPRVAAVATVFSSGGRVGIGLGVGVVGGGTIHELLSAFMTVPI